MTYRMVLFFFIVYYCDVKGGMKAVVWTDSFQMVVMFAGMLTLLISGCIKLGGIDVAWDVAYQNDRIKFLM